MYISDPSKIKRILYTILNIILITGEKPTNFCGLLRNAVKDVIRIKDKSHVKILDFSSLA